MKSKKQSANTRIIQILNAIIWAVAILSCSYLINGEDNQQLAINILIVAAGIQISLIGYFINRFVHETHIES
jgi:O-antigen/teichoic acid export membrane protein